VTAVAYAGGDKAKGVDVTLENRDQLVLPATLRVSYADGTHADLRVPVETWMQRGSHVFHFDGTTEVTSATVDPDHRLPDRDRSNNEGKPAA